MNAADRQPRDVLEDAVLKRMAERGGARSFPAHVVLVHEGDASDALFILLEGVVKVYGAADDGREVVYNTLGPGQYFGELSFDGGTRSASVMSLVPCRCIVVSGANAREFLAEHPDFALHLVKHLIGLLRLSTGKVKSLALDDVYGRLARLLQDLAVEQDGRRVVPQRLTQQDLAERIGASREMVSRIIKQLVQGGYVEQQAGRLVLLRKLPAGW